MNTKELMIAKDIVTKGMAYSAISERSSALLASMAKQMAKGKRRYVTPLSPISLPPKESRENAREEVADFCNYTINMVIGCSLSKEDEENAIDEALELGKSQLDLLNSCMIKSHYAQALAQRERKR